MGQVEVTPDRMGLGVKGRHPFGEGQVTQLPGLIIAHLPGTFSQGHPHRALQQSLHVHHQIKGPGPQLLQEAHQSGGIGAPEQLAGAEPGRHPDFVQGRVAGQQRRIRRLHQLGDMGAGVGGAQRLQRGQGMEHVPEGTEFDE